MERLDMKYLFIKNGNLDGFFDGGGYIKIIDDLITIFRSKEYNEETDNLYHIGNEIKLVVEPVEVYHNVQNRVPKVGPAVSNEEYCRRSLKDDLGVGDYRG